MEEMRYETTFHVRRGTYAQKGTADIASAAGLVSETYIHCGGSPTADHPSPKKL